MNDSAGLYQYFLEAYTQAKMLLSFSLGHASGCDESGTAGVAAKRVHSMVNLGIVPWRGFLRLMIRE